MARILNPLVFYSLLALIVLVAIPYGTVEPWWKGLFQSLVFALAFLALAEKLLRGRSVHVAAQATWRRDWLPDNFSLCLPLFALLAFALLQTIPSSSSSVAGIVIPKTLSADPFQTRLVVVQLGALVLAGWLLTQYTSDQRRLRRLVETIILTGVASAAFGLWRQSSQATATGFLLPNLRRGFGYGQFINSNHFAFLMELVLGLTLGIVVGRGARGWRLALYLGAAAPMFVALVLANSRGGILSILCQLIFLAAWLVPGGDKSVPGSKQRSARARQLAVRMVLILVLLIGSVVTVVFVGGDPLAGRIDSLSIELDRKTADTFTLRPTIWRATWELIKHHPVAGVGFGGYWIAITQYHRASGDTTPQEAHSDYLELLASGGVIAAGLVLWLAIAFATTARRRLRLADPGSRAIKLGALAGIITVAIHSLVDFGLHLTSNALIFTAFVAIVCLGPRSDIKGLETVVQSPN